MVQELVLLPLTINHSFFFLFFWQGLTLSPRQECFSLNLPGSTDVPISASWGDGTIGMSHHTQVIFVIFVKTGFHHVTQASLKLLGSSHQPPSISQSGGITGVSHHAQPLYTFFSIFASQFFTPVEYIKDPTRSIVVVKWMRKIWLYVTSFIII